MSLSDFIVFRTFLKPIEADMAKIVLDAAGIESFIRSDGTRPNLWMGAIELLVHADDVAKAEEVLGNEETNPNGKTIWEAPPHRD